jgi:hypothetical protein
MNNPVLPGHANQQRNKVLIVGGKQQRSATNLSNAPESKKIAHLIRNRKGNTGEDQGFVENIAILYPSGLL